MLSSNIITVNVFKMFAVKCPKVRPKISDFWGSSGVTAPKREETCPGPISTIMQNFTPIGATVKELSVARQWKKNRNNIPFHYSTTLRTAGTNMSINEHWSMVITL